MGSKNDDSDHYPFSSGKVTWMKVRSRDIPEPRQYWEIVNQYIKDLARRQEEDEEKKSAYFPGLRSDIEAIERSFFVDMKGLTETAKDMKEFLSIVKDSSPLKAAEARESLYFPGLRKDLEAIESSMHEEMNRLYDIVEDMNKFLDLVDDA